MASIYAGIDWVLSAYDADYENVRYAEPNKLYESIFFETPIIVSRGTFLAERVESLGVGLSVDASKEDEVVSLVDGWTEESSRRMVDRMRAIPKADLVDHPDAWVDAVLSIR